MAEHDWAARIIDPEAFAIETKLFLTDCPIPREIEAHLLLARTKAKEIAKASPLRAAAERVCWFDWSYNDEDSVAAIEALRKELKSEQT